MVRVDLRMSMCSKVGESYFDDCRCGCSGEFMGSEVYFSTLLRSPLKLK